MVEKIILSLMIGILVGLEREHWRSDKKIYAGVRTFAITCITGTLAVFLGDYVGIWMLVVTTLVVAVSSVALIYIANIIEGRSGLTTSIALFCTYLLGVVVAKGLYLIAIITALILTFLLIEKKPLHSFAENLSEGDISSALKFLSISVVLYPIVPEEPIYGILSLKTAMLIVVMVSLITFVSYVSLKKLGPKGGIPYSGLFGGFISSEATIAALSGISRRKPMFKDALHMGAMLSVVSMIISNSVIAFIADPTAKTTLMMLPPFLIMTIVDLLFVFSKRKKISDSQESIELGSPFALGPAFRFGAIFAILLILTNYANEYAGASGAYAAAIGGIVSSSAVTASVAALAYSGNLPTDIAAQTAVLAGLVSTLAKPFYVKVTGSPELFRTSILSFIAIVVSGAVALLIWSFYMGSYL